jgi:hypothetical protein
MIERKLSVACSDRETHSPSPRPERENLWQTFNEGTIWLISGL